ncbi:amino acid transporter [Flavobacterium nitrogenifigens]|uniref:Amino acid transporter n=2 Tax=Flavobacterium TaxID=237 RepID=A0A7W7N953_9FLAO|nr:MULTISPECIES: hypothetical protein [Flavobacterium]MBB4803116.1 amino acid transporter [Flavobacterium nitrogenifigens]MBB6388074.1 amino acid transporter [Flavobacterium notoginsengisoli]
MKKTLVFVCSIFLSILIATLFGVLHNQFTYTISDEFFTEYLFEKFGFIEYGRNTPRLTASIIGVWSGWWIGLCAGFIFALIGFFSPNIKEMKKSISGAILIMLSTTVIIGLLGLCYGFLGFSNLESTCCFPLQIKNMQNLIAVSEMHSFSYAGGAIGLLLGALFQIKKLKK